MRYEKEVQVDGKTERRFVKRTCDFCGAQTDCFQNWPPDGSKIVVPGRVNNTDILYQTGFMEEGGGSGQILRIDICPRCFDEKLIPWAKSQGAQPRNEEWAWAKDAEDE